MKTMTLLWVSVLCLTLVGCGRVYGPVEEVKALMSEKDDVLLHISKKLEANPTKVGVDEARKVFEAKKGDLRAKRDEINAKSGGMNYDWKTTLDASEVGNDKVFDAMISKFGSDCAIRQGVCSDELGRLMKLKDDFNAAVR